MDNCARFESRPAYLIKKPKRWGWQGHQLLGDPDCPYVERWAFYFGPFGSIRLHHWIASDDTRAKHDHPSDFATLVLKGSYLDQSYIPCEKCEGDPNCIYCNAFEWMTPGTLRYRKAEYRHCVFIPEDEDCWTLLWFRIPRRRWGFWLPKGPKGLLI